MKKKITTFIMIGLCHLAAAQVTLVPYVGMNATRIYDGFSFKNGGAFAVMGIEVELAKKPGQRRPVFLSVAAGASYLSNGFYHSGNFAMTALDFYTQQITDLKTSYVQVPVTFRVNWQPFPLVEDWQVFLGLGVFNNFLIKAKLEEKYTIVKLHNDVLAPPTVTSYQDSGDVTGYGEKSSLYRRIEFGMKYKRLQISYRLSKSLGDVYRTGLEDDWNVPDEHSWYIEAYHDTGKIIEKYSEIVVGFRL